MSPATEARRRHPSTQPPVPARRVGATVARLLHHPGVSWPDVAAAVLQIRGRSGLSTEELAGQLAIDLEVLRSAEAGDLGLDDLPGALRCRVQPVLLDRAPRWAG